MYVVPWLPTSSNLVNLSFITFLAQLDEKEIELNQQKKETKKIVRQLRKQKSSGEANSNRDPPVPRKRSYELRGGNDGNDDDGGFKGVGSRIAEMEARCSKKLKR